jgi:ERF superfamily
MSSTAPNVNGVRVAARALAENASVIAQPSPAGGLMGALLAVQAAAPRMARDSVNPHFGSRFASLAAIMSDVGPLLCAHQLVWLCLPTTDEHGSPALTYRLTHVPSGEAIEDTMPLMCAKPDPQGQGSALTYARRYALTAVLSLVADDDDDGNAARATAQGAAAPANSQPVARPPAGTDRPCSAKQRAMVTARAGASGLSAGQLADIIKQAAGQQPGPWVNEDAAARWLARALDRLPARLVDDVLEGIARTVNDSEAYR